MGPLAVNLRAIRELCIIHPDSRIGGRWLITVSMSTVIDSTAERVWRALTDPDELVSWDENMVAAADGVDRYPFQGQHARWRYRLGSVQLVMHDRPLEVEAPSRLRSQLRMGSMGYERTFSLQPAANGATRLSMRVIAPNSIPLLGELSLIHI